MYNIPSHIYVYLKVLIPYSNPLFNIYFNITQSDVYFFKTKVPKKQNTSGTLQGRQPVKTKNKNVTLSDACNKHKCKGE